LVGGPFWVDLPRPTLWAHQRDSRRRSRKVSVSGGCWCGASAGGAQYRSSGPCSPSGPSSGGRSPWRCRGRRLPSKGGPRTGRAVGCSGCAPRPPRTLACLVALSSPSSWPVAASMWPGLWPGEALDRLENRCRRETIRRTFGCSARCLSAAL